MATVTSYTAAKMKEILDQTIKFLSIDGSGNLIATKEDNSQVNLGNVKGGPGDPGPEGPPGTTPAILANVSQTAGGVLAVGETSTPLRLTFDLLGNHWYGLHHYADISTMTDGDTALYVYIGATQLQCLYRKSPSDPTATRQIISPMHIWKQGAAVNDALFTIRNGSSSAGPIVYNNAAGQPRSLTLVDLGPATSA